MKKLARLTALLLTGALLLVLTACGAAPLTPEQQAKQEIFNAINEVRKDKGMPSLREVPALTQMEQEFIENFRKAGTNGIPKSEAGKLEEELYNKQNEAGWQLTGGITYSYSEGSAKLSNVYEGDTPEFRKQLLKWGVAANDGSVALSVGVVTIDGKIYWTVTFLKPNT